MNLINKDQTDKIEVIAKKLTNLGIGDLESNKSEILKKLVSVTLRKQGLNFEK